MARPGHAKELVCQACNEVKAKQKSVPKESGAEKATEPNGRLYHDLSTVKELSLPTIVFILLLLVRPRQDHPHDPCRKQHTEEERKKEKERYNSNNEDEKTDGKKRKKKKQERME